MNSSVSDSWVTRSTGVHPLTWHIFFFYCDSDSYAHEGQHYYLADHEKWAFVKLSYWFECFTLCIEANRSHSIFRFLDFPCIKYRLFSHNTKNNWNHCGYFNYNFGSFPRQYDNEIYKPYLYISLGSHHFHSLANSMLSYFLSRNFYLHVLVFCNQVWCNSCLFYFFSAGNWTQGFIHASQAAELHSLHNSFVCF